MPNATGGAHDSTEAWYAVWTRSHCERLVAEQLAAKGFSPFVPELESRSTRARGARIVSTPMFPGYLFVRDAMDKHRYIELLKVRGIVRVLEDGWTRLTPIPDGDIEAIQRVLASHVPVLPHPHLRRGDRVRVVDGPLTGVEGLFVHGRRQKGRLVLSVDLLGRSICVELDDAAVTPC